MSVTVAIRFPLGRYHATPWDRSVNEGAVEWPPSPWRLLRTLVATWYTRWPELPAPVLDGLLEALGDPPSYLTPPAAPGHTRHYLPDLNHKKGATGSTDLTLDPYLWLPRDRDLLVRWDADLTGEQRETLAKLVELMPYLGRAESVCQAQLIDSDVVPDGTWWRPGAAGEEAVRVLAPRQPIRRAALELSTVDVRRGRRTLPQETRWVTYARDQVWTPSSPGRKQIMTEVVAVRFTVVSRAPLMATHGVLLADEVHRRVIRALDGGRREITGHGGATTDHGHAHWLPVPDTPDPGAAVRTLVIWVPAGLTSNEVAAILAERANVLRGISGQRGGPDGYEVKGLPKVDLLLQAAGPVGTVAPELCGPARRWRSLTPYLPVRHRKPKRETLDEFLAQDVRTELSYRGLPEAAVSRVHPEDGLPDRWARPYRRYRMAEHLGQSRPGLGLHLEFGEEVGGPVLLGRLSHFGYGMFIPQPE